MISKILSDYEKNLEETILSEKEQAIWFYKVNEDNIHPIFKPFNFAENKILCEYEHDKESRLQINEKRITFG